MDLTLKLLHNYRAKVVIEDPKTRRREETEDPEKIKIFLTAKMQLNKS